MQKAGFLTTRFVCVRVPSHQARVGFTHFREIYISKEVFDSETFLGDSEFDIFLNEMGEPTWRILTQTTKNNRQGEMSRPLPVVEC